MGKKLKNFYIEMCCNNSKEPYSLQTKCFITLRKARNWLYKSIDFYSVDDLSIYIMAYEGDDIVQVEKI